MSWKEKLWKIEGQNQPWIWDRKVFKTRGGWIALPFSNYF